MRRTAAEVESNDDDEVARVAAEFGYNDAGVHNWKNEDDDYDDYDCEYFTEEDIETAARFGYTLKNIQL